MFIHWSDTVIYLDKPEHHGFAWRDEPDLEVVIIEAVSLPRIDQEKPRERHT